MTDFTGDRMNSRDSWLDSPGGIYVRKSIETLLSTFAAPARGERLLDLGLNADFCLPFLKSPGCRVTALSMHSELIEGARSRQGASAADIQRGDMEDLPFSDNEFDLVTMILSLELAPDPEAVLAEAIRVSRGRVAVVLLNRISCSAHRLRDPLFPLRPLRSFSIFEALRIVRSAMPDAPIDWGGLVCFPLSWYPRLETTDRRLPLRKNPVGAVGGISFPVRYRYRTIQNPLRVDVKAGLGEGRRVPGTVCNSKRY